jgi:hypothetical protein
VEGLAAAALRIAGAERAVALLGAADSIRGAVDHSSLDAPGIRDSAKEQLSEDAFDAAYRRGLGMPYDEALGFASASITRQPLRLGRAAYPPEAVGEPGALGVVQFG